MNWTDAGIILALIALNGFFAATELALVTARKSRLRAQAERGQRGAQVALELLGNRLARVASPLVWLLQISTEAAAKLLPLNVAPQASITEDEVRALVAAGAKEGIFHRREQEMIDGVLRLADRPVESAMIPRGDVIWLDANAPLGELWTEARESGHSRFLLCDSQLEQLIGVLRLADLGEALRVGAQDIRPYARPPLHVPPSVSLLRLLELFRESSVHMAIVTDEYGSIEGIATHSDILRAIAGELGDLGSRERAEAIRREEGSWLVDGQLAIHEAERVLQRNDLAHGDDNYTVGGFVLWHLGRVPVAGDTLRWRDLKIEVVDMDGPRIDKILIASRAGAHRAAAAA